MELWMLPCLETLKTASPPGVWGGRFSKLLIFSRNHPELGRRIQNASQRHAQIRWFAVPRPGNRLIFHQPFDETVRGVGVLHAAQDWTRILPVS
jgi:hypothetical protein